MRHRCRNWFINLWNKCLKVTYKHKKQWHQFANLSFFCVHSCRYCVSSCTIIIMVYFFVYVVVGLLLFGSNALTQRFIMYREIQQSPRACCGRLPTRLQAKTVERFWSKSYFDRTRQGSHSSRCRTRSWSRTRRWSRQHKNHIQCNNRHQKGKSNS